MTRDDVIRLAREAHMHHMAWDDDYIEGTERFAALIAAAEREACVKACKEIVGPLGKDNVGEFWVEKCVAAIRARGSK